MHELSVASAIVDTARRHAGGRPVSVVSVRVGSLRQVVPGPLRFYFEIVTRDTECDGAQLRLDEIAAHLRCEACGAEWEPSWPSFRCPSCASADVRVLAGEELQVDYIEVREEEGACIASR